MRNTVCVLIGWLALGCAAHAGDIIYNSEAAYLAAFPGVTTVDLNGVATPPAPANFNSYGIGPGANTSVSGVNFAIGPAGADNILFLLGNGYYGYPEATISAQDTLNGTNDLLITFASPVVALGFEFGDFFGGNTVTMTLSDSTVATGVSSAAPALSFFGVSAPGGITSVDINAPGGNFVLDVGNVTYESAVPEPASFLLIGMGLAGALAIFRRKQRA